MNRLRLLGWLLATVMLGAMLFVGTSAYAQTGGFSLPWYTVDGGGGSLTNGQWSLNGTTGQPDAGRLSSGGAWSMNGGFWGGVASSPEITPTNTPVATETATGTATNTPTITPTPFTGNIYCVDDDGGPTGGSPCANSTAYTTIQQAANAATAGDQIRIAAGTYGSADFNKNLIIVGGYAGGAGGYGTPSPSNIAALTGTFRFRSAPITTITLQGYLTWASGGLVGYFASGVVNIASGAVFTIAGSADMQIDDVTLNNSGTIVWGGTGNLRYMFGASINNQSGGLFDIRSNAVMLILGGDGGGNFYNLAGATLRKSASTGVSYIGAGQGPNFNNSGTVEVQTGMLAFTGPASVPYAHSGLYNTSPGATVCFCGYINNLTTGAQFTGGGTALVAGGTANINGNVTVDSSGHFQLSGGTLGGTNGNLIVNGTFDWVGGVIDSGTLSTAISSGGIMTFSGSNDKIIYSATINNSGTILWAGTGNIRGGYDSVINNLAGGTFDAQANASLTVWGGQGAAYFNNLSGATVLKSTTGTANIGGGQGFRLSNSGTVDIQAGTLGLGTTGGTHVQTAGLISLNGGDLSIWGPFDMQGGDLRGTGIVGGNLNNSGGRVIPGLSPGILTITGNYTQGPSGALDIEIGGYTPGTQHDRLDVGGQAVLNGTLNVSLINGFEPSGGDAFRVVNYASRSGAFAIINAPGFTSNYNADNLTLVCTLPTSTATIMASHTPTSIPTFTTTSTATPTATDTALPSHTSTTTRTHTVTATSTSTPTMTATLTHTSTPTPSNTASATATSTATSSPTPTCVLNPDYVFTASSGVSIVPGTSYVAGSTCDSCTVNITLPFSYSFYGTPYSQVNASNKGVLQFLSNNSSGNNTCPLPNATFNDAIFAYWDDHSTNINDAMGIHTSVSGTAPNRIFNIEWRSGYVANDVRSNFEVRLHEGQPKFDMIYSSTRRGFSATIGVQKGTGERSTQYSCNTSNTVQPGLMLTFDQQVCQGRPVKSEYPSLLTSTSTPTRSPEAEGDWNGNGNTCTTMQSINDVPSNSPYYGAVTCMVCRGIVSGYGDGTFRPASDVTRGQIAKIVASSAGFNELPSGQTFEDVPEVHAFYPFIQRMASRGIIDGYPCGRHGEPCGSENRAYFRPGNNATRGQMSKIVANAARIDDPPGEQRFQDVAPGSALYDFIQRLANRGVMAGYECGGPDEPCSPSRRPYFRPGNNATRGQTSKIVSNNFFPGCEAP